MREAASAAFSSEETSPKERQMLYWCAVRQMRRRSRKKVWCLAEVRPLRVAKYAGEQAQMAEFAESSLTDAVKQRVQFSLVLTADPVWCAHGEVR